MADRLTRLNPQLRRELSLLLRTRWGAETAAVTVVDVSVTPDLYDARVVYSVLGDEAAGARAEDFFRRHASILRRELARRVVLKHFPRLTYERTTALEDGGRVLAILDEIDATMPPAPASPGTPPPPEGAR